MGTQNSFATNLKGWIVQSRMPELTLDIISSRAMLFEDKIKAKRSELQMNFFGDS